MTHTGCELWKPWLVPEGTKHYAARKAQQVDRQCGGAAGLMKSIGVALREEVVAD